MEDVLKVSEDFIENVSRDDEFEKEESMIEDPNQEERNDDVGLLDVGNVHVNKDVDGLEVIPTMSRDHEIPTFEPLTPSLTPLESLELHVPTLEPNIIPIADHQKEGEGQSLHGMSIVGTFVHDHFAISTFHDPYYPYVLQSYIIEFIKQVAIVYSYACLNFLKISSLRVWDDDKFPLCGIG